MAEKIELALTKKDFAELLRHLYIANWILTDTLEDDVEAEKLDRYFSKFLAVAKKHKLHDLVTYDKEVKETFLNEDIEEECLDAVDDYEDSSFWEALASRLAERDVDDQYAADDVDEDSMTESQVDEKYGKYLEALEVYEKEFSEYGIDRIKISTEDGTSAV
jgi:hypothetical protein